MQEQVRDSIWNVRHFSSSMQTTNRSREQPEVRHASAWPKSQDNNLGQEKHWLIDHIPAMLQSKSQVIHERRQQVRHVVCATKSLAIFTSAVENVGKQASDSCLTHCIIAHE